jgi:hypothetical protein
MFCYKVVVVMIIIYVQKMAVLFLDHTRSTMFLCAPVFKVPIVDKHGVCSTHHEE